MSISSTRKVSGATVSSRKNERLYPAAGQGEAFVEHIDTANNVLIKKDLDEDNQKKQEYPQNEETDRKELSGNQPQTYVAHAIEALEASGIYDNPEEVKPSNVNKIGIYGNNQSMISNEKSEKKNQSYLKHFYENNTPMEEVDKLV